MITKYAEDTILLCSWLKIKSNKKNISLALSRGWIQFLEAWKQKLLLLLVVQQPMLNGSGVDRLSIGWFCLWQSFGFRVNTPPLSLVLVWWLSLVCLTVPFCRGILSEPKHISCQLFMLRVQMLSVAPEKKFNLQANSWWYSNFTFECSLCLVVHSGE